MAEMQDWPCPQSWDDDPRRPAITEQRRYRRAKKDLRAAVVDKRRSWGLPLEGVRAEEAALFARRQASEARAAYVDARKDGGHDEARAADLDAAIAFLRRSWPHTSWSMLLCLLRWHGFRVRHSEPDRPALQRMLARWRRTGQCKDARALTQAAARARRGSFVADPHNPPPSTTRRIAPYGFRFIGAGAERRLIKETTEWLAIARLVELRRQGHTYKVVAETLKDEGIRLRRRRWLPAVCRDMFVRFDAAV